jgi:trans-aconitate methyltransferase
MIDSSFIISYTNALYSTPAEDAPRYDEFRDMFSSGQIKSKQWVINELEEIYPVDPAKKILVVGAWYGTLGLMLHKKFPRSKIKMIDIDPRCEKFVNNITQGVWNVTYSTADMYRYDYNEDIVVNTSCEHIPDIKGWLNLLPANTLVVLQSNNLLKGNGHINCVHSEEEFIKQAGLKRVIYTDKIIFPMYTRFMIIGYVS